MPARTQDDGVKRVSRSSSADSDEIDEDTGPPPAKRKPVNTDWRSGEEPRSRSVRDASIRAVSYFPDDENPLPPAIDAKPSSTKNSMKAKRNLAKGSRLRIVDLHVPSLNLNGYPKNWSLLRKCHLPKIFAKTTRATRHALHDRHRLAQLTPNGALEGIIPTPHRPERCESRTSRKSIASSAKGGPENGPWPGPVLKKISAPRAIRPHGIRPLVRSPGGCAANGPNHQPHQSVNRDSPSEFGSLAKWQRPRVGTGQSAAAVSRGLERPLDQRESIERSLKSTDASSSLGRFDTDIAGSDQERIDRLKASGAAGNSAFNGETPRTSNEWINRLAGSLPWIKKSSAVDAAFANGVSCDFDEVNQRLVDFELPDIKGRPTRFSQMPADLTLLVFWGTWCKPCHEAMPHLVELQKRLATDNVQILGISYEEGSAAERRKKSPGQSSVKTSISPC